MAVPSDAQKGLPEDLQSDNRDVADLWKDALKQYKGIVGFDLERKFDNTQAMIDFGAAEMNAFHKFRHNNKKVDKLRSLFAANIDYLQKGSQQLISAATPAFPPAAAIGTAITYLLTACKQVSADYDVVVVFFNDMNSFLERVSILETRLPSHKAYQNCLMDVFTSFLTLTGFAHKYIELGRFKKWITNLIEGQDSDLGGARKKMDKNLSRLQNATEFAILGNSEELKKMNGELQSNQVEHTRMLEEQREVMESIHEDTENIRNDMAKLLKAFEEQNAKHEQKGKPSIQDASKPASATRVRNNMPSVEGEGHEYRILKETLIPDTCTWVFSEPEWEKWIKQTDASLRPILAIIGEPGTGKSHLAAAVHDQLEELARADSSNRTGVAHFYFREQHKDLCLFLKGLITVINQIAEQSAPLCEKIHSQMTSDETFYNVWIWRDLLLDILGPCFSQKSPNRLFIIFDGLDEMADFANFLEFIQLVSENKYNISFVITTRPDLVSQISAKREVSEMKVTKEQQSQDLNTLIWNRINDLHNLRKFSRYVQQRIAEKLADHSPNLLYAEHTLLRLNNLGREGAVLQAVGRSMPSDLHELYDTMLSECQRRMPLDRQHVAAKLLHWLAYCYRILTLDEVNSLLVFLSNDANFTLEEIPEVASKFLQIGDPGFDAEARESQTRDAVPFESNSLKDLEKAESSSNPDSSYNDGDLPVNFKERSMRAFFKDSPPEITPLRLKSSEAHRQIFVATVQLARPEPANAVYKMAESLRLYSALRLFSHFCEIRPEEHSLSEKIEVMESFTTALTHSDFANKLSQTGMVYRRKVKSLVNERAAVWAELISTPEIRSQLSQSAVVWWDDVAVDSRRCRLGIARAYLQRVYAAPDVEEAQKMFKMLYGFIGVAQLDELLINKGRANFPTEFAASHETKGPTSEQNVDAKAEDNDLDEETASLGLPDLFPDVHMDDSACRAVGELLLKYKHAKPAEVMCTRADELLSDQKPTERLKIRILQTKLRLLTGDTNDALHIILESTKDLNTIDTSTSIKRLAWMERARVETKIGDLKAAAASYSEAKSADPTGTTPGDALVKEIALFQKVNDNAGFFRTLKSWSPLDRLTWMAWNYSYVGVEVHFRLRCIALAENEGEFLIDMYREGIQFLDRLNAGAPLRVDLALTYLRVLGDLTSSRKVLDEVFESHSDGWLYAVTDQTPQDTMEKAVEAMTDTLYELFKVARDPKVKTEIFESLKGLLDRPLSLDVPLTSSLLHRRIVMAAMSLKMGNSRDFQERLQGILDDCFASLKDKVSWNDSINLEKLGHCLAVLSRATPNGEDILRYARIVASALFSNIDPEADREEEEQRLDLENYGPSDTEDDDDDGDFSILSALRRKTKPPENEGDLQPAESVGYNCDGGVCNPFSIFAWWGDSTVYYCTECSNTLICEICYKARHNPELGGTPIIHFCDSSHNYMKLPVEGWRGVKDGKLMLEGEEPVPFNDFLDRLQNEICKDAWERYWGGI